MAKILIGDDNSASRDLLRAILKGLRCEIIEARHGQEVLDLIRKERPELVLLDIDMPILSGYGVLKQVREDERFARLPVVAVTAYAMDKDKERALAAGFAAYITKPVRAVSLRNQVRELLALQDVT